MQRQAQNPPTLEDFRKMWTVGTYTPDTDTLYYRVYECWPDRKHAFAHVLISLAEVRDLLKVVGSLFDVEILLYNKVIGHALYCKGETGKLERLRLRKGREVMDAWERWL